MAAVPALRCRCSYGLPWRPRAERDCVLARVAAARDVSAPLDRGPEDVLEEALLRRAHLREALGYRADRAVVLGEAKRARGLLPLRHVPLLAHQSRHQRDALGLLRTLELGQHLTGEVAVVVLEQLDRRGAAALHGHPLEQLRQRLLVRAWEQGFTRAAQAV